MRLILERHGYKVIRQSDLNVALYKANAASPLVILPKRGDLLGLAVQAHILIQAQLNDATFLRLREEVEKRLEDI